MEENNNLLSTEETIEQQEKSIFNFQTIYTTLVLNWKWFAVSLIICFGSAVLYLRYTTPIYQAYAKLLIKDDNDLKRGSRNTLLNSTSMGVISNSAGIDNEMEILRSLELAEQTVRDLKLYVTYIGEGKIKDQLIYGNQPISVDIDAGHLNQLRSPINLTIQRRGNEYSITGSYYANNLENNTYGYYNLNKTLSAFPATINTRAGILTFTKNAYATLEDGQRLVVNISTPISVAYKYAAMISVAQVSKSTTIAQLLLNDEVPQRAIDYLKQLVVCYNRQANEDKNEIARRTEMFINTRLEKINAELGTTEGQLESYQKRNSLVDIKLNAGQTVSNAENYNQKLAEANMQIYLFNSISDEISNL